MYSIYNLEKNCSFHRVRYADNDIRFKCNNYGKGLVNKIMENVGTDKRSQTKKRKMKNWNKVRNVKFVEVYFTVYIVLSLILKVIITVVKEEGKRSHPMWFTVYTNYVLIQRKDAS